MEKGRRQVVDTSTEGGLKYAKELAEKNTVEAIHRIVTSDGFILLTFSGEKDTSICNLGASNVPKAMAMLRDALRALERAGRDIKESEAEHG